MTFFALSRELDAFDGWVDGLDEERWVYRLMAAWMWTLVFVARRASRLLKILSSLGWLGAVEYLLKRRHWLESDSVFRIHPRGLVYPLFVRRNSSDLDIFGQIFIDREY